MFGRLFSFLFYIFVAYIVFTLIKLIFNVGKTAGEFNRRVDDMKQASHEKTKKADNGVIELKRDDYKVE